jgi:hypothetical protein
VSEGRQGWRYDSIEEWYETISSVVGAQFQALRAVRDLFPSPGLAAGQWQWQILWLNIGWREVEKVSFPFLLAVEPWRRALEAKMDGLHEVALQRTRYSDDLASREAAEFFATYREWKAIPPAPRRTWPSGIPFVSRPEQINAHALALYDLIAPKAPPDRRRGRRWPDECQLYNANAVRIVGEILTCYYGAPVANVKRRIQAARARAQ